MVLEPANAGEERDRAIIPRSFIAKQRHYDVAEHYGWLRRAAQATSPAQAQVAINFPGYGPGPREF